MDRRSMLKNVLCASGAVLLPAGAMSIVGRSYGDKNTTYVGTNSALGNSSGTSFRSAFSGKIMGTGYSVKLAQQAIPYTSANSLHSRLYNASDSGDNQISDASWLQYNKLQRNAHHVLQQIDHSMSTWRGQSELSRFNESANTDWREVSDALLKVIESALHTSKISAGAFDASVSQLVDLWGFGAGSRSQTTSSGQKPSVRNINSMLQNVGYQHFEVNPQSSSIRKLNATATLDLSGIAKGYAVDELATFLDNQGFEHYLVEVGGELRSRGRKSDGSNWRVAIERPQSSHSEVYRIVELHDHAVATSGDYRHFFIHDNRRYSHSIDPRTGFPVDHGLASVSVIAETALQADALSTALMIMGPDDAMDFAEQHHLAAQFILRTKGAGLVERMSQRFNDFRI